MLSQAWAHIADRTHFFKRVPKGGCWHIEFDCQKLHLSLTNNKNNNHHMYTKIYTHLHFRAAKAHDSEMP